MPQTANPQHRNQITRKRTTVPQRVIGGNSSTQERRGFCVIETVRYCHQCLHRGDHVLLVSTVITDAANFHIAAIAKVPTSAFPARVVLAAVPAHADTLSLLPGGDTRAQGI